MGGVGAVVGPAPLRWLGRTEFVERWSWAMGQPVHVMVFAASEHQGLAACAAALATLRGVEARLSLFDDASDVCELNRCAGRRAFHAEHDLLQVLRLAQAYRSASRGAFDPAVEPLMRAWGFHRARHTEPTAAEIDAARAAVRAAVVRLEGDLVWLPSAHTQLDFGGIGVGYGIDRALAVLKRHGIRSGFIDVSGDCAALGAPPGTKGWRVDIAEPQGGDRPVAVRYLRDAALATSANTQSVVRYGRAVRGHVLNPATGWPATGRRQVSVIARSAVAADALSTAALISGSRPSGADELITVG